MIMRLASKDIGNYLIKGRVDKVKDNYYQQDDFIIDPKVDSKSIPSIHLE